MTKIKIQPIKDFYKVFPEYKNKTVYFMGWSRQISKRWGCVQIKVKINKRNEFFHIEWFKDLKIN